MLALFINSLKASGSVVASARRGGHRGRDAREPARDVPDAVCGAARDVDAVAMARAEVRTWSASERVESG